MATADRKPGILSSVIMIAATAVAVGEVSAQPGATRPMIRTGASEQVSPHVHVILDENVSFVPNVGIVIGERATLIVDTGLGNANGEIVLEEARRLSGNGDFYITATHFHPEHDLGATAFPSSAKVVRWSAQQAEADSQGEATIARFAGFSTVVADLLADARYRPPDIVFDDSITIDLGGVHVVATGVGPNHTLGDTVFWIPEDRVLFTGDVVMSVFPAVSGQTGDIDKWLANLESFNALSPEVVVPAHGRLGGVDLVRQYRGYLESVRERVGEMKRRGDSLDAITDDLSGEIERSFPALAPPGGNAGGRIRAAIQAAFRIAE